MKILSFTNAESQITNINLDNYDTTIVLKDTQKVIDGSSVVMDITIGDFGTFYGIPLLPYKDVLYSYVRSDCIPIDFGSIVVMPIDGVEVTPETIGSGQVGIMYMNAAETLSTAIAQAIL